MMMMIPRVKNENQRPTLLARETLRMQGGSMRAGINSSMRKSNKKLRISLRNPQNRLIHGRLSPPNVSDCDNALWSISSNDLEVVHDPEAWFDAYKYYRHRSEKEKKKIRLYTQVT